jgi:DNA repair exonuclease SbcCD ATPase subunit
MGYEGSGEGNEEGRGLAGEEGLGGGMSLEKIDQYIKELEAIRNYDKVKAENERLSAEVRRLREENEGLKKELSAKRDEAELLRRELSAKSEEIQKLRKEVEALSSRVKELEKLKALTDGRSLKEALELFLKAKEEEIKRRAKELFDKLKSEWEGKEKPREVFEKALKTLEVIIGALRPGLKLVPAEVVESGLIEKVRELLNDEVSRRLDEEFRKRVEKESERKSLEKLERLKSVEWPRWFSSWYRERVEPQINRLESEMRQNAIKALRGPWKLNKRCDKRGTPSPIADRADGVGIEQLLRSGCVAVECQNPNCLDYFFILPTGRHRVRVTLRELIEGAITSQSPCS